MSETVPPSVPFIWPEPRVSAGVVEHDSAPLFADVARSSVSVFGVASAIDQQAIDWIEGYLARGDGRTQLRLVISVQPTCRTTESDLLELVRLAKQYEDRAAFCVHPERSLGERSSNLLCFLDEDDNAVMVLGPSENLGFGPTSPSQANLVTSVPAPTLAACCRWFDYLWGVSGPLDAELAASMPRLVLPKGDAEATRRWHDYRMQCLDWMQSTAPEHRVSVDAKTGKVTLLGKDGQDVVSPTDELVASKLDEMAEGIARIFEKGMLVTVDKTSRVPPLEAPVKPEWFGVDSFRQTGVVSSKTSIKVRAFDEAVHKKIDRFRRASGDILPHFTYALGDGMRWIPKSAIPLFEHALDEANARARSMLDSVVGDDVGSFLEAQRVRIRNDAQQMYNAFHPDSKIPPGVVDRILEELNNRLGKTRGNTLLPKVAYSPIAFSIGAESEWSSPWGQAYQLIKGIAEFPRKAMTDPFFLRRIAADEDDLIQAMDVTGDALVRDYGSRNAKQRAAYELDVIEDLDSIAADAREKCEVLWTLVTTGDDKPVSHLIREKTVSSNSSGL